MPELSWSRPGPRMSIFAVNYLCREVLRDHAFRAAMKADPAKALAPLRLTDEERHLLIAGDVGNLFRTGANAFLTGTWRALRFAVSMSKLSMSGCAR